MYYTLFPIIIIRRNKINFYCELNFPRVRFFEIICVIFYVWSNFIKIFFSKQYFIFITVIFVLNIIITQTITNSYWFIIFFSSLCLKRFLISLSILSLITLFSFFNLKRFLTSLIVFFFKTSTSHHYML